MTTLTPHIGDRPIGLATHLRQTATYVANGRLPYLFKTGHTCNVGCLARVVTGLSGYELAAQLNALYAPKRTLLNDASTWDNWADTARQVCPLNPSQHAAGVVGQLQRAGMTVEDFDHLEHLSHPALQGQWATPEGKRHYEIASHYVVYLMNWATAIESYRATHPEVTPSAAPSDASLDAVETRPLVTT